MPAVPAPVSAPLPVPFSGLSPAPVWAHFASLCAIPRPSKHEAALRGHLAAWAAARGIAHRVDAAGNLTLTKPATAGREDRPGVVLQGHLDMVCQQNAGTGHDFHRDPIRPVRDDGWLVAETTTLGADNGIGVALALAVLDADDLAHGPLEVLLTVDEEAGMGGAQGLAPGALAGRLMINLDTENWGEFYLGCAGGLDALLDHPVGQVPWPDGHLPLRIVLDGLRGGHSGVDIHLERGNAIKLLVRALRGLEEACAIAVAAITGGTARNAIPREAEARVAVAPGAASLLGETVGRLEALFRQELAGADDGLNLRCLPAEAFPSVCAPDGQRRLLAEARVAVAPGAASLLGETVGRLEALFRQELAGADDGPNLRCMPAEAFPSVCAPDGQRRLLAALHAAPNGVKRWSTRVPGVVETSDNLGVLNFAGGRCQATFMVRSLVDSGSRALGREIADLFSLIGARVELTGDYPGWAPNPASKLLALAQAVYGREFGGTAAVKVIHAGLECGIIGAKHPGLDILSFGPDIRGAHAPGERVRVESVAQAWRLLTALLAAVPPEVDWNREA
ncbi:MAG TPA: aminoacyl-histidine dipeptidase [Rhodocyclaceae bacterium]|nr:aminoacyl-histidine dipeptidase [Rhodocyclaceae bacterium]